MNDSFRIRDSFLRFCPQCGSALEPDKKFCTSCGASLTPDLTGTDRPVAGQTLSTPAPYRILSSNGRVAVAGLIIVILGIVLVGYPLMTGSNIVSASVFSATPAPMPVPTTIPGSSTGGSYVVVETIETPVPTTMAVIATTLIPTTLTTIVPTTVTEIKPIICSADQAKCDNRCVDLRTDSRNCGYCNTTCSAGNYCLNGQCMQSCSPGQTSCADGCFDLLYDAKHCGSCLNACPRGLICYIGQCNPPATPMPVPI